MDPMDCSEQVQAAMSIAVTKKTMDFAIDVNSSLINGTIQKGQEVQNIARANGLAQQGIGTKLNIVA